MKTPQARLQWCEAARDIFADESFYWPTVNDARM
jgi:hypothetical protein